MTQPTFSVKLSNNIVMVDISGDWNMHADIGYLTVLDETISNLRGQNWALFADLRGWRVSDDVVNFKHNETIQLVRINQQAECWLVDDMDQGQHVQHHVENAGIPFCKCLNKQDAKAWLIRNGFSL